MAWDLRRALLRKEEFESARLTDFEFREMVRGLKRLALSLGQDAGWLLDRLADHGLDAALAALAEMTGYDIAEIEDFYRAARAEARRELITERGDPSPVRLA